MIKAELRGKISLDRPILSAMEDVLTSYVFSAIDYLRSKKIFKTFVEQAVNIHGERLSVGDVESFDVFFWPYFPVKRKRTREIDTVVVADCDLDSFLIGFEAKYKSGPSDVSVDQGSGGSEGEGKIEYQLAEQLCGLLCQQRFNENLLNKYVDINNRYHIYLTQDYAIPYVDVEVAIQEYKKHKCDWKSNDLLPDPEEHLFWLSWRHLYAAIKDEKKRDYQGFDKGEINILDDLLWIMKRRGLRPFDPFKHLEPVDRLDRFIL